MSLSRRSPTAGSERSDSYSYPRRSVTGMKKLMPLRLGSPLSSPLSDFDSAFTDAPDSFNIIYEQKQDPTDSRYIPWMQCERESPLLSELDSTKFRETPIYSKPGSPFLARAYFGGDEDCFKFPPPKSTCQTVRIVESDDDIGDMQSPQLEYYADYAESLDGESEADSERSEHKSPDATLTSLEPSRQSGLSIMCRGLDQYKRNTLGIEFMPVPPLAAAFLDREDSIIQRRPDESWIDSDSSRCSSPTCPTQILDACATPLSPAKPHMVEVNSFENLFDIPPRTWPLPIRTITPRGWATRKMSVLDSPPVTPIKERFEDIPPMPQLPAPLRIPSPPISTTNGGHTPPISPLGSPFQCSLNYTRSVPRHRFNVHDIAEEVINLPLIEAICDGIDGSPRDLQLDTFCITEIRRRNQQSRVTTDRTSTEASPLIDNYLSPPQRRLSKRSIRRKKSIPPFKPPRLYTDPFILKPSISTSLSSPSSTVPLTTSKTTNLRALTNIFPNSDDWWRGVLYAHLLAYNYVSQTHTTYLSSPPSAAQPSKVNQMLGLPLGATIPELSAIHAPITTQRREKRIKESFEAILNGLASCISRIVGCMAGDYERIRDTVKGMRVDRADHVLVRSLAEVVKMSEIMEAVESRAAMTGTG